jgi:hypothetical protein
MRLLKAVARDQAIAIVAPLFLVSLHLLLLLLLPFLIGLFLPTRSAFRAMSSSLEQEQARSKSRGAIQKPFRKGLKWFEKKLDGIRSPSTSSSTSTRPPSPQITASGSTPLTESQGGGHEARVPFSGETVPVGHLEGTVIFFFTCLTLLISMQRLPAWLLMKPQQRHLVCIWSAELRATLIWNAEHDDENGTSSLALARTTSREGDVAENSLLPSPQPPIPSHPPSPNTSAVSPSSSPQDSGGPTNAFPSLHSRGSGGKAA